MHYNMLGVITQEAQAVADAIRTATEAQPVIMRPGETLIV